MALTTPPDRVLYHHSLVVVVVNVCNELKLPGFTVSKNMQLVFV